MSKFMFVVPPFFGHISPSLSLGAELISKGHEVVWVGVVPLADEHIPKGGRFLVPHDELSERQGEIQHILDIQDHGAKLSGLAALKLALEDTYVPICRYIMPGLERLVKEFQPDMIIHDEIMFAGAICAYRNDIPYTTTSAVPPKVFNHSSDELKMTKVDQWGRDLTLSLQKEFGIEGNELILHSKELCLFTTSREFAMAEDIPDHYKFIGPLIKGRPAVVSFDWERLNSSPYPKVYVTLGTLLVDVRKQFFQKLVEAFGDEPITFVVATNPNIFEKWPDNFIVQSYVPQSQIIPKVDAVICHGGFNTVNETFINGLPMLITPIAYDQFYTASLIENMACGISIRYRRLRVTDLKNALNNILNEEKYKDAATRVQKSLLAGGGAEKGASYIEAALLSQPKPTIEAVL